MNAKAKISVVVITYNQQDCITKALDSLTSQKEWIFEIVVSDDCSKDNTWQVVTEYAKKYPNLVKPYRNETNLGIYGNMLAGYRRATGNVLATLSGDDEFLPGCFENAYNYIKGQDVQDKVFHLYMDRRRHFADNRPNYTFKNNLALSPRRLSYALRGYISEPTFFSPKLLERCTPSGELGIGSDKYWSYQRMYHSDIVLYLNSTSIKYNAGIGVSVRESKKKFKESELLVYNKILFDNEMHFETKDLNYVRYRLLLVEAYYKPSWIYLYSTTIAWMKSIDFSLGLKYIGGINHLKNMIRYMMFMKNGDRLE